MGYLTGIIKRTDKRIVFIIFSLFLILNALILNKVVISNNVYFNTFSDQISQERINELISFRNKWDWIGYVLIPAVLLVKLLLITLCIEIGVIIKDYKISIKQIFHVVLIAETVFIIAGIIRNITLYFLRLNTLEDIQYFYPLSILNLINVNNVNAWFIYPLKLVNFFTIAYFFVLAYGLSLFSRKKPARMLFFSFGTYGLCLLVWVMFIIFINVYLS